MKAFLGTMMLAAALGMTGCAHKGPHSHDNCKCGHAKEKCACGKGCEDGKCAMKTEAAPAAAESKSK